ncbi:MAG: hypothetical protein Q8Q32_00305 [bacterium]|nr:hypothetical protein [bacterium]
MSKKSGVRVKKVGRGLAFLLALTSALVRELRLGSFASQIDYHLFPGGWDDSSLAADLRVLTDLGHSLEVKPVVFSYYTEDTGLPTSGTLSFTRWFKGEVVPPARVTLGWETEGETVIDFVYSEKRGIRFCNFRRR